MPIFVDTNVLVYSRDAADAAKHATASRWMRRLWETGDGRLSIQVLQEYYVTTTRKLRPGLSMDAARADVHDLSAWRPVVIDPDDLQVAWSVEDRFGLSFWDSLIVAAAHIAACDVLLTEDLQHEGDFDGVRVLDPFRTSIDDLL
ncbi:MAG: PIN domain-containing protein [Actinobacteria bacterium]|nr:PIN domain-containing protein [Actinomycetota bacterium]